MSVGGSFLLTVNQGLQDEKLNAISVLDKRIKNIIGTKSGNISEDEKKSIENGNFLDMKSSILPSLNYIENTHNIFINGSYKPFVPTTFEYIKTTPSSNVDFGEQILFQPTQVGNFINDMVLHIKISGLRAKDVRDRVRYVAFPAHKLLVNVQLVTNHASILDEYFTNDINDHYQTYLSGSEKRNWCNMVGQEVPEVASLTSDPSFDMFREQRLIGDGFQTLKYSHDTMEITIPLLFWFNELRTALPSHIIPWGMFQIKVQLADFREIVGFADYGGGGLYHAPKIETCDLYINNIFTIDEIYQIYSKRFNWTLIRTHKTHHKTLKAQGRVVLDGLKFPIEHMIISVRPRENLSLSQHWYKNAKLVEKTYKVPVVVKNPNTVITGTCSASTDNGTIMTAVGLSGSNGFYTDYNFVITGGVGYDILDITKNRYYIESYDGATKEITVAPPWTGRKPDSSTTFELFTPQLGINTLSHYKEIPIISRIQLDTHGNTIWNNSAAFFQNYNLHRFGKKNMGVPETSGYFFVPFCFYPFVHDPTGSYNSSVGRELYLTVESEYLSSDYIADLVVNARTINFLYTEKNIMTIRYIL
jgi:hypothetical protein